MFSLFPPTVLLAASVVHGQQTAIFFLQIVLLIVVGRLLGEWMQCHCQPAVLGQLLAGILLGPSFFGFLWPAAQQAIFPVAPSHREMLNAVSELGVLLLLLLTGMEMDLKLVKRVRQTAAITSAAGIVIPFLCGFLLGHFLPTNILPDPNRRLLTSLFLATALSISSVKIVAVVLREVDFLRRNLGQVILSAAILDDTVGWVTLALISGLAAKGAVVLIQVLLGVLGTAAFLIFCFTIGSRLVARMIRWSNDHFVSEMAVITVILVITITLALVTHFIGVHTVLGAFMAGIMIGQSPILTKQIEGALRGLIVALFMPVFFGVAGLSIDLKILTDPHLLALALLFIAVASVGKLVGCYLGSRLARLNPQEALAVGFAMNARGSTEVILATIGLSMGLLNQHLFTMIVLMAVVTTLAMPPLLRWALARVPIREEEKARIKAEVAEEKDLLPKLERVLVGVDPGETGQMASRLAGWLIGARNLSATVLNAGRVPHQEGKPGSHLVLEAANAAAQSVKALAEDRTAKLVHKESMGPMETAAIAAEAEQIPVGELITVLPIPEKKPQNGNAAIQILEEAKNGYGLLFLGLGRASDKNTTLGFSPVVERIVQEFPGPMAFLLPGLAKKGFTSLQRILVPTTGADYSRFGAEVAVAIAKGCGATITALHVSLPPSESELLRHSNELLRAGRALLDDIVALGKREGIRVTSKMRITPAKEVEILRQATEGAHQLMVIGTKAWTKGKLTFGHSAAALIQNTPCPILIVKL